MLTTFSMAAARNFPLTLQATGARLGSPGEPTPPEHSSGEPSLKTHPHTAIITLLHYTTQSKAKRIRSSSQQIRKDSRFVKDARLLQSILVLVHVPDSNGSIAPAGRQKTLLITPPEGDHLKKTNNNNKKRDEVR